MSDPKAEPATAKPSREPELCAEIGQVMSSIWQRQGGVRPSAVSTEVDGDRVRCVIEEGVADETADDQPANGVATESSAYRHEATAAVARITRRSVSAMIAKRDAKTGVATQTFILERKRVKN